MALQAQARQRKAQASLELLLATAAFLAVLAAWLPAVSGIMKQGKQAVEMSYLELALADLAGAGEEVRILGSGNSRELNVRLPCDAKFRFSGGAASADSGSARLGRPARFSSQSYLSLGKGLNCVAVENRNQEITYAVIPCTAAQRPS